MIITVHYTRLTAVDYSRQQTLKTRRYYSRNNAHSLVTATATATPTILFSATRRPNFFSGGLKRELGLIAANSVVAIAKKLWSA